MSTCPDCGRDMVCTFAGDFYEPSEWECPACGMGVDDADSWDEPDMELVEDRRAGR